MSEELEFIHDVGHGWLRVPLQHLVELGVADEITQYSYMNNWYAFLEEDCDAGIYLDAIKKVNLPFPDIKERHVTDFYSTLSQYGYLDTYSYQKTLRRVDFNEAVKVAVTGGFKVRLYYGVSETGHVYPEEHGIEGYLNLWEIRGDKRFYLRMAGNYTKNIETDSVLRVVKTRPPYKIVYTSERFDNGEWVVAAIPEGDVWQMQGYKWTVNYNGVAWKWFKSLEKASAYVTRMTKGAS